MLKGLNKASKRMKRIFKSYEVKLDYGTRKLKAQSRTYFFKRNVCKCVKKLINNEMSKKLKLIY